MLMLSSLAIAQQLAVSGLCEGLHKAWGKSTPSPLQERATPKNARAGGRGVGTHPRTSQKFQDSRLLALRPTNP
jgi:hypothetical protein